MNLQIIKKYVNNPKLILFWVIAKFPKLISSDELFLRIKYYINFEKWPDLANPISFSEKLQWLKLYDRKPEYVKMVDKADAKPYVASIIGDEYIIPTLGVYNSVEEIDFDVLPNKFVLKCTHDSGGVVICKDKFILDRKTAIKKLNKCLNRNFFWQTREWPYKQVRPRIIAEKYMENSKGGGGLRDYKFFCFSGGPKYCQVISDRNTLMCIDFFDEKWDHQPFHEPREFPFSDKQIPRPVNYEKMWELASTLSKGHPFLRVDFYEIDEKIYFGELTFFPTSGVGGFLPNEWDYTFGSYIKLPEIEKER